MLQQVEPHFVPLGQPPPGVGVVDAEFAHDPAFGAGNLHGTDGPVQSGAAQRTDAGIIPEEPFLVLHAFPEGEFVFISLPHELKGGILREGVGESGEQVVEEAVLAEKVRLLVIRRDRVVGITAKDLRDVHDVGIQDPVMEVGVVLTLEREEVLQPVQLGQIIRQGLVEEGEIGLQLHPFCFPERLG